MAKNKGYEINNFAYLPNGTGCSSQLIWNKEALFNHLVIDKLARTIGMFEWEGFGDKFDPVILEIYLQTQGYAIVTKVNGELYVLNGTLGGQLDASYRPTIAIPVSPYLQFSASQRIGEECVVVKNNELYQGFNGINSVYGAMLAEALTTLKVELINARVPTIVRVLDDAGKTKAAEFFRSVINGDIQALVTDETIEDIVEGAKSLEYNNKGMSKLKDTMEMIQYVMARWNIEVGLNDNYNMKREAINSTEVDSNTMPLETLVDAALKSREKAVKEIEKVFGVKGSVKLGADWKRAYEYVIQALENAEADNETKEDDKIEKEREKEENEDGKE